jgi:hypothetical protein
MQAMQDGSSVEAEVYVWVPELRYLLYGEWDYEEFRNGPRFQPYLESTRQQAPFHQEMVPRQWADTGSRQSQEAVGDC